MTLRELWKKREVTLGGWCAIPSSFSAELMGRAGFDWVCIDMQHGLIGYDAMVPMLQALAITQTPAFVRVPWNEPDTIMKALDAGAAGVIVPMVASPDEAAKAVGACRYPPVGYRSWGPIRAALGITAFSPDSANENVVCAVMVETKEAVGSLEQILAVPGIDAVFVGPSDLALSNGLFPSPTIQNPEYQRQMEAIIAVCRRHQTVTGIYCVDAPTAVRWRDAGFQMLALKSDALLLRHAADELLYILRSPGSPKTPSGRSA